LNETSLFVDWITVWQIQPEHAPHNSGSVVTFDGTGNTIFERCRATRLVGSYSTSCSVKSDGRTVVASGNYGRLNREDNLFNHAPEATLGIVNKQLRFLGLPFFRWKGEPDGDFERPTDSRVVGNIGAASASIYREPLYLSRVDITKNYACGSLTAARSVIRAIQGKCVSRVKKGIGGDASVWWSNTRYMLKVYIKALEMEAHGCTSGRVYEYARDNGIIRLEVELKARELSDLGWSCFDAFVEAWNMKKVHQLFSDYEKILDVGKVQNDSDFIDSLPVRLRVVALAFLAGRNVRDAMSRTTFYRYRKQFLEYGIDLADERPAQINTVVRYIEIVPLAAPDWYWDKTA
jgi:hypothetical protein